jgi:hypothetical protein
MKAYDQSVLAEDTCKQLVVSTSNIPGAVKFDRSDVGVDLDEMIINLVKDQLQKSPVILYCTEELKSKVENEELAHYFMDAEAEHIKEDLLRSMDTIDSNLYQLVIATDPFAMRGFDYRAKTTGIALVLAKSFRHEREAIQGLNRVGRNGDECKRILFK